MPGDAEIVLETTGVTPEETAQQIVDYVQAQGYLELEDRDDDTSAGTELSLTQDPAEFLAEQHSSALDLARSNWTLTLGVDATRLLSRCAMSDAPGVA